MNRTRLGVAGSAVAMLSGLLLSGTAHATGPQYFTFTVAPDVAVPGQVFTIVAGCQDEPENPPPLSTRLSSAGWILGADGKYRAIDHPGRYTARFDCLGDGTLVGEANFTIVCPPGTTPTGTPAPPATTTTAPPATTTTTSAPPSSTNTSTTTSEAPASASLSSASRCLPVVKTGGTPTQHAPEVTVRPQGAPQTGGGGEADVVGSWH